MASIELSDESKIRTNFRGMVALGCGLAAVVVWVTLVDFKIKSLEAKASTIEETQGRIVEDRVKRREEIVAALNDFKIEIKTELAGLKAEVRALNRNR